MSSSSTTGRSSSPLGSAYVLGRDASPGRSAPTVEIDEDPAEGDSADPAEEAPRVSPELRRVLAEVKGQAQFLLYLADQIEDSVDQLDQEADGCQSAFLCKILAMYSGQLETKHQGLGDKISETCQEIYVTVREIDEHA